MKTFPYQIHTVLTDNWMAFADPPENTNTLLNAVFEMPISTSSPSLITLDPMSKLSD